MQKITTDFEYPDGDLVDLYIVDGKLTDMGETIGWIGINLIQDKFTDLQRQKILDMACSLNVFCYRSVFWILSTDENGINHLGKACAEIAKVLINLEESNV